MIETSASLSLAVKYKLKTEKKHKLENDSKWQVNKSSIQLYSDRTVNKEGGSFKLFHNDWPYTKWSRNQTSQCYRPVSWR